MVDKDDAPVESPKDEESPDAGGEVDSTSEVESTSKAAATTEEPAEKQADEVYCSSCGEAIKKEAEICPHCGVRQASAASGGGTGAATGSLNDHRAYELQKIANKDITTVMVVSLLLTPAGYWMIGKTGLAIINFLTFNYFLLGFIIVPFHTRNIIKEARAELERNGAGW